MYVVKYSFSYMIVVLKKIKYPFSYLTFLSFTTNNPLKPFVTCSNLQTRNWLLYLCNVERNKAARTLKPQPAGGNERSGSSGRHER